VDDAVNTKLGMAMLPWLAFDLVTRAPGVGMGTAGAMALGAAWVIGRRSLRTGTATAVEATAVFSFAPVAIVGAVAAPGAAAELARWAIPLSTAALAAVMGATLLRTPATTDYARLCVPPQAAGSPRFGIINMSLTATWALAVASVAGAQALSASVHGATLSSVLGWLVPLGIVVAVAKATSGMWVDYQERYVTVAPFASTTEDLLWDFPLWPSEDA